MPRLLALLVVLHLRNSLQCASKVLVYFGCASLACILTYVVLPVLLYISTRHCYHVYMHVRHVHNPSGKLRRFILGRPYMQNVNTFLTLPLSLRYHVVCSTVLLYMAYILKGT